MLEAHITQQVISSSTPPSKIPTKPEPNPHQQCNCVILKGGLEDSKGVELKEGGEANRAMNKEKGDELEAITFGKENSLQFLRHLPLNLKIQLASLFLVWLVM